MSGSGGKKRDKVSPREGGRGTLQNLLHSDAQGRDEAFEDGSRLGGEVEIVVITYISRPATLHITSRRLRVDAEIDHHPM